MVKASDVKALRNSSGAGIMECKKALIESGGDIKKAGEILKKMGLNAVKKREERSVSSGMVFLKEADHISTLLALACETDFAAKNQDFISLGRKCLESISANPMADHRAQIDKYIQETVAKLKENIKPRGYKTMKAEENELIRGYIHGNGKIGVLVKLKIGDPVMKRDPRMIEAANDLALHIAAFNPVFISRDDAPKDYISELLKKFRTEAEKLGKGEKMLQGIIDGKLNKHLAKNSLLEQKFVKDETESVGGILSSLSGQIKTEIEIADFAYFKADDDESVNSK